MRYHHSRPKKELIQNKIIIFFIASGFLTFVIIGRLFQLQVLEHNHFEALAAKGQYGVTELPAERGEIIMQDYHSDEEFLLATNTTLNLLYVDPVMVKDPAYVGNKLAPILFNLENEREKDNERIKEAQKTLDPNLSEEEKNKLIQPLSDAELQEKHRIDLIEKIGEKQRKRIILRDDFTEKQAKELNSLGVPGIETAGKYVFAYTGQIGSIAETAEKIAPIVEIPSKKLSTILKGENRYVVLQKKLSPDASDAIRKLFNEDKKRKDDDKMWLGLGFKEEYYRFYPENTLAASLVGYVSGDNVGQYGIESSFNTQLQGKAGKFQAKKDSVGRQITVGESILEPAVDGDDIVLTIDRSIQLQVEKLLEEGVKKYQADSGQIVVINPQNGEILAMANYPNFDPNNYGEVFKKVEVSFTPEEIKKLYPTKEKGVYYFYKNEVTLDKYTVFEEKDDNGNSHYYRYENFFGPEVYHNKAVSWPYEPGSVFKTIAMAAAIDDGDVTPNTTFNDSGPVGVDWNKYKNDYDFFIKNVEGYFGIINMQTVLAKSLNTGMTFVAKKMGPALFYSYLKKFGFLERTDIEFDNESAGKVDYYDKWTESELATHAFGQGLTVTMLQLVNAYAAIANGGVLMQPHIVREIRHDDKTVSTTEPRQIRRVISEDTASKIREMLKYAVEHGVASPAKVEGHFVAGKTGTSQTYRNGRALSGKGTTTATFAGFGPVENPQFVVLVKYDRPRTTEWGSSTAAPTFQQLAGYLFDYYNIPPDKQN